MTRLADAFGVFQSTLPRGSDVKAMQVGVLPCISIHAPSRERRTQFKLNQQSNKFQSTLPRGSDSSFSLSFLSSSSISIHAPSRERLTDLELSTAFIRFQSTLPRGSDILPGISLKRPPEFQSTLPRGSDNSIVSALNRGLISIHAPSRERLSSNT